ncbi:MAG: DMT family transporter [Lautropia sp.]|nr:DMT family transporter [Lautropia sp.]
MGEHFKRRGTLEMVAAMLICGTIGVTVIVSGQTELSLIFYRCLFGALVLLGVCLVRGYLSARILSFKLVLGALAGGAALLANWYFLFAAYRNTSIGIATAVYNTQPVMMILLGWVIFRERLNLATGFWIAVSMFGLIMLSEWGGSEAAPTAQDAYLLGIIQALAAAALYAIAALVARVLKQYPPSLIALFQFLLGVVVLWPHADLGLLLRPAWNWDFGATLCLGVVHTGIMYILLYGALQKIPAYRAASISFIYPALAVFIDAVFLDVRLEPAQWWGMMLILLGAAGINLRWTLGRLVKKLV